MINVRLAANKAIQVVNPDILAPFFASTGYTLNAERQQVPDYAAAVNQWMQVQAVSAAELRHLEGMNVEGVLRSVRMWGNTQGVVRVNNKGGDLLYFPEVPAGTPRVWKVVKVLETWPDWCSVIVNLQTDTGPPGPLPE